MFDWIKHNFTNSFFESTQANISRTWLFSTSSKKSTNGVHKLPSYLKKGNTFNLALVICVPRSATIHKCTWLLKLDLNHLHNVSYKTSCCGLNFLIYFKVELICKKDSYSSLDELYRIRSRRTNDFERPIYKNLINFITSYLYTIKK